MKYVKPLTVLLLLLYLLVDNAYYRSSPSKSAPMSRSVSSEALAVRRSAFSCSTRLLRLKLSGRSSIAGLAPLSSLSAAILPPYSFSCSIAAFLLCQCT
jgi:hypothetical protein